MPKRRQYKTGSVYRRASDGHWLGSIEAGYTKTGARRRVTVTGKTQAETKRLLQEKALALAKGEEAAARTTVKAWATTWLDRTQTENRANTVVADRAASKWIIATIGHRRLDQLTPADVRAVDTAILKTGNSTSTARRYRGTLERMLKDADSEGYPIAARVLKVKKPAEATNDRQAIPTADVLQMLAVIFELPHRSRWVAAFLQGMRINECLGLTWDQVNLDEESLLVSWQLQPLPYLDKHDRSKGFLVKDGEEVRQLEGQLHLVRPKSKAGWRKYPLVPWMTQALADWQAIAPVSPHGLVWPALDGSPADENEDRREWEGIQGVVGTGHPSGRYFKVHEARHSTAMLLLAMKVPESIRIQIMGHSSIASTRAYEHDDISVAREWLTQAAGRLELG